MIKRVCYGPKYLPESIVRPAENRDCLYMYIVQTLCYYYCISLWHSWSDKKKKRTNPSLGNANFRRLAYVRHIILPSRRASSVCARACVSVCAYVIKDECQRTLTKDCQKKNRRQFFSSFPLYIIYSQLYGP